jgi:glutamyl-tRNA synthetase
MLNTRIAPSPTGDMHLGTARTAYFNWLAARATGGKFILRIDDTDLERSKPEHTEVILETMEWLGLDYDEIHYQSKRQDRYEDIVRMFKHSDKGFIDDGCLRLTAPFEEDNHLVMMKSDGSPTYHFASVLDDIDMDTNYIIRGNDHELNLPKHQHIHNQIVGNLGPAFPDVQHVSLITKGGKKMSKRDDAASMLWYRDQGYSPEAVLNFMLRLGWSPDQDDKSNAIITRDKAVEMFFDGGHFIKAKLSGYDQNKLDWFNKKYKAMERMAA